MCWAAVARTLLTETTSSCNRFSTVLTLAIPAWKWLKDIKRNWTHGKLKIIIKNDPYSWDGLTWNWGLRMEVGDLKHAFLRAILHDACWSVKGSHWSQTKMTAAARLCILQCPVTANEWPTLSTSLLKRWLVVEATRPWCVPCWSSASPPCHCHWQQRRAFAQTSVGAPKQDAWQVERCCIGWLWENQETNNSQNAMKSKRRTLKLIWIFALCTYWKQLAAIKIAEVENKRAREHLLLHQVKVFLDIIEGVIDSSKNQGWDESKQ